ncbi:MAG: MFS transporter [Desulfovibrio sp.]|nr:MFS transporter [Desulfovibrio sp.]
MQRTNRDTHCHSTPLNRGEYTGLFTGMHRLGSLVGMLVGGILADSIGFTATATLFGTISALAICAAFLWIPKSAPSQHNPGSEGGVLVSLNLAARDSKALWMVAAGCFIAFATQGVITSTLSRLIAAHTGGGVALFAVLIGAASLVGFFQALRWLWEPWLSPFIGRLSDTRFERSSMLCAVFGLGVAIFALLAQPSVVFLPAGRTTDSNAVDNACGGIRHRSGLAGRRPNFVDGVCILCGLGRGDRPAHGLQPD